MKKPMKTASVKIRTSDGSIIIGDVNLNHPGKHQA